MISSLLAVMYKIWQERNNALWNLQVQCIRKVIQEVQYIVKHRVKSRMPKKKIKVIDIQWLYRV